MEAAHPLLMPLGMLKQSSLPWVNIFYCSSFSPCRKRLQREYDRDYDETDLLDTIGLNGEERMPPSVLIAQVKELLTIFLNVGSADVNLQTTGAGRTVFHLALASEVRKRVKNMFVCLKNMTPAPSLEKLFSLASGNLTTLLFL